jgi:hypothetical protein
MADEVQTEILVKDVNVNPKTGHITIKVFCRSKTSNATWDGHEADYGVDAKQFHGQFGGEIEQLLKWVSTQHEGNVGAHGDLVQELMKLKGKKIG